MTWTSSGGRFHNEVASGELWWIHGPLWDALHPFPGKSDWYGLVMDWFWIGSELVLVEFTCLVLLTCLDWYGLPGLLCFYIYIIKHYKTISIGWVWMNILSKIIIHVLFTRESYLPISCHDSMVSLHPSSWYPVLQLTERHNLAYSQAQLPTKAASCEWHSMPRCNKSADSPGCIVIMQDNNV